MIYDSQYGFSFSYWDIYKYVRYGDNSMSSIEELFDNNKKMGSMITLLALLIVVLAVLGIIVSAVVYEISIVAVILMTVGTVIYAYLVYQFGLELRDNSTDKVPLPFVTNIIGPFIDHTRQLTRVSIFAGVVRLMGIGLIISSLFNIIATFVVGFGMFAGGSILLILIGFVFLWASREISIGGNHSFMWILLVILFALALIGSLYLLIIGLVFLDLITVAQAIITLILSGYALYLALSNEVKVQMGA